MQEDLEEVVTNTMCHLPPIVHYKIQVGRGVGTTQGISEEAALRMATTVSGGGVGSLASRAGKVAWAGGFATGDGGAAEKGLTFRVVGVKGEE